MPDADLRASFGARLRHLRQERGWSQEALALAAGINRTYLGDVERGERNVALDNIGKLAAAFGISLSELLSEV
jgi:transcriptional regulator with XRE-family HTH domain